ncbi:MAG: flagellar export chaperone FliS [Planctomycetaceae bacterium]
MIAEDQYLETKVMTATPWQLHLMVVDAAIRKGTQAEAALERGDFEAAHFALNSSRDCVTELLGGLNGEQLPEVVSQLRALFGFVYRNLVEADMLRDTNRIADAVRILRTHRETWLALAEKLRDEAPAAPATEERRSWET